MMHTATLMKLNSHWKSSCQSTPITSEVPACHLSWISIMSCHRAGRSSTNTPVMTALECHWWLWCWWLASCTMATHEADPWQTGSCTHGTLGEPKLLPGWETRIQRAGQLVILGYQHWLSTYFTWLRFALRTYINHLRTACLQCTVDGWPAKAIPVYIT